MNSATLHIEGDALSLRKRIQDLHVNHGAQLLAQQHLQTMIDDALKGFEPTVEILAGPSRVGKSEVLRVLKQRYAPRREEGRLQVPVLFAHIKAGTAPKDLPLRVLEGLGVPLPKSTQRLSQLDQRMVDQLELAGVRVVVFEEASHLVDVGSRVPKRQASDWFKDLVESRARVSVVLVGLPRLNRLLQSNEQLKLRAGAIHHLLPYSWTLPAEVAQFSGCCRAFLRVFERSGYSFEWPEPIVVRHLYVLSVGLVGVLAKYFRALAQMLPDPCRVTPEHMHQALRTIQRAGDDRIPLFREMSLPDEDLLRSHATELTLYGLQPRRFSDALNEERRTAFTRALQQSKAT